MKSTQEEIIRLDMINLFGQREVILDQNRLYRDYTTTPKHKWSIGFEIEGDVVYYAPIKNLK